MMASEHQEKATQATEYGQCPICGVNIDSRIGTFEQRLIRDKDFCGECFNEIMNDPEGETLVLPRLEFSLSGNNGLNPKIRSVAALIREIPPA